MNNAATPAAVAGPRRNDACCIKRRFLPAGGGLPASFPAFSKCSTFSDWPSKVRWRGAHPQALVWVLPLCLFAVLLVYEAWLFGRAAAFSAFFSSNVSDNESLATLLFTFPTWSAIWYSIGAFVKRRMSSGP